MKVNLNHPENE